MSPQTSWSLDPAVLVGVLALAVLYAIGWRRARASGGSRRPSIGRLSLFAGGLLVILAALVSPLESESLPGLRSVLAKPSQLESAMRWAK